MLLGKHDQLSRSLTNKNQQILQQVSHLTSLVSQLVSPPACSASTHNPFDYCMPGRQPAGTVRYKELIMSPKLFSELDKDWGFLLRQSFQSEQAHVYYVLGLLRG